MLESPEGEPIGTLGVYDIVEDHGECGRSCCIGEPSAAVEASILLGEFIYNTLKLSYTTIWVYEDNKAVLALNHSYGYEWVERKFDENGNAYRVGVCNREKALEINKKLKKKFRLI